MNPVNGIYGQQSNSIRISSIKKNLFFFSFRVDELNEHIQDHIDAYGNVLIQTVDLARAHYFLKYASLAKVNILLSGTTGSCKSHLLDTFLSGLGLYEDEK
jgi:serine kinase of HPr protein (carbohydrate metabolism regulator)